MQPLASTCPPPPNTEATALTSVFLERKLTLNVLGAVSIMQIPTSTVSMPMTKSIKPSVSSFPAPDSATSFIMTVAIARRSSRK